MSKLSLSSPTPEDRCPIGVTDGVRPCCLHCGAKAHPRIPQDWAGLSEHSTKLLEVGGCPSDACLLKAVGKRKKRFPKSICNGNFYHVPLWETEFRMNAFCYELILEFLATNACGKTSLSL